MAKKEIKRKSSQDDDDSKECSETPVFGKYDLLTSKDWNTILSYW